MFKKILFATATICVALASATPGFAASCFACMHSDRRLKRDIKRIGMADNGLAIYSYSYASDPMGRTQIGFMADEVEGVHPDAVLTDSKGFKMVNYALASAPAAARV